MLIADIIEAAKRLDAKGLLIGKGGNLSVRRSESEVLITASNCCKAHLTPALITRVHIQGDVIEGPRPARDMAMHLEIYRMMPQVRAIVHSHPTVTTGLSVTAADLNSLFFPEILMELGNIQMVDYAVPTTTEVPQAIRRSIEAQPSARAFILKRHGALTCSEEDIWDACYKMEVLESAAKALVITRMMGGIEALSQEQIAHTLRLLQL